MHDLGTTLRLEYLVSIGLHKNSIYKTGLHTKEMDFSPASSLVRKVIYLWDCLFP